MKNLSLIVLIFSTIIISLIYNLYQANKKINTHFEVNNQIIEIAQINRELYLFSDGKVQYKNYDYVEKNINSIKTIISNLVNNPKYLQLSEISFKNNIQIVKKLIEREIEIIEKQKSYIAIYNNSIRNIQILKSKISHTRFDSIYNKTLTLNYQIKLDKNEIRNEISEIKSENNIENIFLSHINIIFNYYFLNEELKKQIEDLNIQNEINLFHNKFEKYTYTIIQNIKVAIVIFVLLLIIAIILFCYYAYKVLKNKIELDKLKNALDISDNIVLITDKEHRIKYVNQGFEKTTKYKLEEVIGKKPSILSSGRLNKEFYEQIYKTIHNGEKWTGEFINKDKNGRITFEKSSITPIKNHKGEIVEFLAIKLDITKEKEYQNVLTQQSKMVSMGELLENIAHQWRQPLSIISSLASGMILQLSYKDVSKEENIEAYNKILKTTEKLSTTIDDLKNFFYDDKDIITFNIENTIEKAVNFFNIKLDFNHINIKILNNSNTILVGKESEFIQVILNILNNSLDSFLLNNIEEKEIDIRIYNGKNLLRIEIEDNAGGIDKDIISKIFELYFTTKHKSIGTGVGLYMAYQIITQKYQGTIEVKNTQKFIGKQNFKGTTVLINIPI